MKILAVIPARYASTRFPGKPLVQLEGKSMIRRVFEQAKKTPSLSKVVVATDDARIQEHVREFGDVVMTNANHASGTDRCAEALSVAGGSFDYVINIQGDEPFIQPAQIELLASRLDGNTQIATLVKAIKHSSDLFSPNIVKAVISQKGDALYFSRSPIPHIRNTGEDDWIQSHKFFKHIGMYAYRSDVLYEITKLNIGTLEKAESLEQLRWLENGYRITVEETELETVGIDTPEDMERARQFVQQNPSLY